ncbi:hypothetical protein CBW18_11635 [Pedobacter sp. AJM]|nr:hypothetical protein CBW18_11635 [Pedobacter sp. AJM]
MTQTLDCRITISFTAGKRYFINQRINQAKKFVTISLDIEPENPSGLIISELQKVGITFNKKQGLTIKA